MSESSAKASGSGSLDRTGEGFARGVRLQDSCSKSRPAESSPGEAPLVKEPTTATVWVLWFEQERVEGEDTELLIGVYSTKDSAQAAIERVKNAKGFKDFPEGFHVYEYPLNVDGWRSGFIRD